MKKIMSVAAILSVLMSIGVVNASIIDTGVLDNWIGNLEFNGTITNTSPVWIYHIPDLTIAAAKNWDVKRENGIEDGSSTKFLFNQTLDVLVGIMKAPAIVGGAGMQPVVTFGEDKPVVWDTAKPDFTDKLVLVTVKDGVSNAGTLSMRLSGQAVTQGIQAGKVFASGSYESESKAFALLQAQPYYSTFYGSLPTHEGSVQYSTHQLGERDIVNPSSALVTTVSKLKLTVSTNSIPEKWTAILPISITVK